MVRVSDLTWAICTALMALAGLVMIAAIGPAHARDFGQWEGHDAKVREWFEHLKQPDQPNVSCCGEADAVEADDWALEGDHIVARVTNGHGILPDGTEINVPLRKLQQDTNNPTGHAILFLSPNAQVYCFVVGTGI